MGNFYTNITLRTTDTDRVAAAAAQARRAALIAPPDSGCTVVFSEASEDQDVALLQSLAARLSRDCGCPAFAVLNHDDDALLYLLYDRGEMVDRYSSNPEMVEVEGPSGDVQRLCSLLGAEARVGRVEDILRNGDRYTFATQFHEDLVKALGLSLFAVGTGFNYLEQDEYPEGLDQSQLRRV